VRCYALGTASKESADATDGPIGSVPRLRIHAIKPTESLHPHAPPVVVPLELLPAGVLLAIEGKQRVADAAALAEPHDLSLHTFWGKSYAGWVCIEHKIESCKQGPALANRNPMLGRAILSKPMQAYL
jgi:hypothetical protein